MSVLQLHPSSQNRFNVLLTEDRPHADEHWIRQLIRLLEPQGVVTHLARTGQEAVSLTQTVAFHAAVVDLGTPVGAHAGRHGSEKGRFVAPQPAAGTPGGLWLLEVLRHVPAKPPVVLLGAPPASRRQAQDLLRQALRLGAFSVMRKPVDVERVLGVIRKLVDRQYSGNWPQPGAEQDRGDWFE
ncbi:MAG: response regulator [Phycisphaeraceae bacterium]|nr:response regulator [Phycisphaeraceae bacterium]